MEEQSSRPGHSFPTGSSGSSWAEALACPGGSGGPRVSDQAERGAWAGAEQVKDGCRAQNLGHFTEGRARKRQVLNIELHLM